MKKTLVNYIYVDMNSYFASVEQQEDPSLRGKPVGIITIARKNAVCIAASYEAKLLGIGMGSRMDEARQMAPDIQFRAARHDVYVDYHHKIKHAVDRIYPVDDTHSVDEFSCKLTGMDRELEQAKKLAEDIRASIYRHVGVALRCSIGLGPSLLLAKLAGELKKPAGLDWLTCEVMPQKISHLALKDIPGIGKSMARRLYAANIQSVEQLYAMSPKYARKVWHSVSGERFILALQGQDVPQVKTSSHSLGHGQILSPKNRTPDGARLVARRLLIKAATRLRRSKQFTSHLYISVTCSQTGQHSIQAKLVHTQDSFYLLKQFDIMWGKLSPKIPINVSVMLGGLAEKQHYTGDLFVSRPSLGGQTKSEKLCAIVDALNQQYGQDTIIYGEKPIEIAPYTGAKIAFGRIPTKEEFRD